MIHETNEIKNLTIVDEVETFNSIYSKEYVPQKYIEKIKQSNLLLLPNENFRDNVNCSFPEFTMEIYRYLKLNDQISTEICIDDEEYKTLELHSEAINIPIMIIKECILQVVLNMISSWLYDKVKAMNKRPEEISTSVNVIVEKNEKSMRIVYQGSIENFGKVIRNINEKLHF